MPGSWSPGDECTVYTVHALRTQLMAALQTTPHLTVDLGDVAEFDGAGLQLLLSARREAQARGGRLRLRALSPAVTAVLDQAGLPGLLAVDPETTETP